MQTVQSLTAKRTYKHHRPAFKIDIQTERKPMADCNSVDRSEAF